MAEGAKEPGREFRLEGIGLLAVAVVLVAGFAAAFFLGRWYERRTVTPTAAESDVVDSDPLANVEDPGVAVDASEDLSYFDTLEGEGKALEPGREARARTSASQVDAPRGAPGDSAGESGDGGTAAAAAAGPGPEAASMSHFVQVFAGRSRSSAEELMARLQRQGYTARLRTVEGAGERLYKVQVGYALEDEARQAVEELRSKGFPSAFYVTAG